MKEKFKAFMDKMLDYFDEHELAIVDLGYSVMIVFTVIYLICASISVLKNGISYRR